MNDAQRCVPHAPTDPTGPEAFTAPARASCARCGAPLPRTKSGTVKRTTRFCQPACRLRELRERRTAARIELAKALNEIRIQLDRAEDALAILGLLPVEQRHGESRRRRQ